MSTRFSLNSSNHSGRSAKRSSEFLLLSLFLIGFWVLEDRTSFLDAISPLRSNTEPEDDLEACRIPSLLNESSDGDVEDETLSELVDNPGRTRGTKLSVFQMLLFPYLSIVAFDR